MPSECQVNAKWMLSECWVFEFGEWTKANKCVTEWAMMPDWLPHDGIASDLDWDWEWVFGGDSTAE